MTALVKTIANMAQRYKNTLTIAEAKAQKHAFQFFFYFRNPLFLVYIADVFSPFCAILSNKMIFL